MRWIKEPLVHFVFLGALLFVAFEVLNDSEEFAADEIVISSTRVENLATIFSRTWRREPTGEELKRLVEDYLREEILYREGLSMGLDQNDTVIRRRVKQKVEFLAEDASALNEPTEDVLVAYLDENADYYAKHPSFTFKQIFFSYDKHGERAVEVAKASLQKVSSLGKENVGDTSLVLEAAYSNSSQADVARMFGNEFAAQIDSLPLNAWSGPLESGYGAHLVYVEGKAPGRVPELAEIREIVRSDYMNKQRDEFLEGVYAELKGKYRITVEELGAQNGDLLVSSANAQG